MFGVQAEPSRKIVISQEINSSLARDIIYQITEINELDDEREQALKNYERQPIEIYINSGGGSATDGFAIIGAMEMSDTPIITYGMGIVASMALGIFMKGDIKISSRHTRFMYHSVAYGVMGNIKDHEDAQRESDLLQRMYDSLFEGTGITQEIMDNIRHTKSDYFFSSKQAVELGVADVIIPSKNPEKRIQFDPKELQRLEEEVNKPKEQ